MTQQLPECPFQDESPGGAGDRSRQRTWLGGDAFFHRAPISSVSTRLATLLSASSCFSNFADRSPSGFASLVFVR